MIKSASVQTVAGLSRTGVSCRELSRLISTLAALNTQIYVFFDSHISASSMSLQRNEFERKRSAEFSRNEYSKFLPAETWMCSALAGNFYTVTFSQQLILPGDLNSPRAEEHQSIFP